MLIMYNSNVSAFANVPAQELYIFPAGKNSNSTFDHQHNHETPFHQNSPSLTVMHQLVPKALSPTPLRLSCPRSTQLRWPEAQSKSSIPRPSRFLLRSQSQVRLVFGVLKYQETQRIITAEVTVEPGAMR
jgi:hypothetical protein